MRVKYHNYPSTGPETQVMQKEVNKLLSIDIDLDFRFDISFTSYRGVINNFVCKVYPREALGETECLATLHRGDEKKMLHVRQMYLSGKK